MLRHMKCEANPIRIRKCSEIINLQNSSLQISDISASICEKFQLKSNQIFKFYLTANNQILVAKVNYDVHIGY